MTSMAKKIVLSLFFCSTVVLTFGANSFATQRLQRIAIALSDIPFEQLSGGIYYNYSYNAYPLTIRVNEWNEVDHIGLHIFDTAMVKDDQHVACDFLERYLLELELTTPADKALRLGVDKVQVAEGSLDNVGQLKGCDYYEISKMDMRKYHVAWFREKRCILALVFDMDYQLLSGCNAIELENNYLRDVMRIQQTKELAVEKPEIEGNNEYAIIDGGSYLSPSIRGDRYYRLDSIAEWIPVCSDDKPYWSAANTMLSPFMIGDFMLKCTLDMYGYKEATFQVGMEQWVAQTIRSGCGMYFGIKSRTPKTIRGTLFCPNPSGGYCHMMSVEIPVEMFNQGKGEVTGRLYAYVPLHNIGQDYFDLDYMNISTPDRDDNTKE